jgi:hypothetical protein
MQAVGRSGNMDDKTEGGSARNGHPRLQIRDIEPDVIRLMWQPPRLTDDPLARALAAEEAMHDMFRPLRTLIAERRRRTRGLARLVSER